MKPTKTEPEVSFHQSVSKTGFVASIRGIDITEMGDAYTASELRSISRYLLNAAESLEYMNNGQNTKPLFEASV